MLECAPAIEHPSSFTDLRIMKATFHRICFPLVGLTLILMMLPGCASSSGGGYPLKLTRMNVDWKMTAYREAVVAGNLTTGQQERVNAAYQAYQTAFQQALTAANGNLESPAPANVRQLATELIGMIDSLN
jgi:hypothetical protein